MSKIYLEKMLGAFWMAVIFAIVCLFFLKSSVVVVPETGQKEYALIRTSTVFVLEGLFSIMTLASKKDNKFWSYFWRCIFLVVVTLTITTLIFIEVGANSNSWVEIYYPFLGLNLVTTVNTVLLGWYTME